MSARLLLLLFSLCSLRAFGQTNCSPIYWDTWGLGSRISVVPGTGWSSCGSCGASAVAQGIDMWESACDDWANGSPSLIFGFDPSADVFVDVHFSPGQSTNVPPWNGSCGSILDWHFTSDGHITDAGIIVWEYDAFGTPCHIVDTVAHELGHAMGFQEAASNACNGRIMGSAVIGSQPRTISSEECVGRRSIWKTWAELDDEKVECDIACNTNNSSCTIQCHQVVPGSTCGASPVLIDLDGNGFHLSGLEDPVRFDHDADGAPEITAWTLPDELDAFLALDRNHNGLIDNGAELFGNNTPLAFGGRALHGYEALAEFDKQFLGGNADGYITPADAIWSQLRVWIDANHDGTSSNDELSPLDASGLLALSIEYVSTMRRDRHGNLFRFKSSAFVSDRKGRPHVTSTVDVYFRVR